MKGCKGMSKNVYFSNNKKKKCFKNLLLFFSLLLISSSSLAEPFETADHLKNVAKEFVTNNITLAPDDTMEVIVSEPNVGLHLSTCANPIKATLPKEANKELITAVELSCDGNEPWQILLPVDIQMFTNVIVTKQALATKAVITDADIDYIPVNKNRLFNGYFKDRNEVIGLVTMHPMMPGTILTKKNLTQPVMVHKNQIVTLTAIHHQVMVTMQGVARTDGAFNSVIKVFNPSSKRLVDAVITGPNQAQALG
jgi:flagellar basal body P-ring formation protein FlgA